MLNLADRFRLSDRSIRKIPTLARVGIFHSAGCADYSPKPIEKKVNASGSTFCQ